MSDPPLSDTDLNKMAWIWTALKIRQPDWYFYIKQSTGMGFILDG